MARGPSASSFSNPRDGTRPRVPDRVLRLRAPEEDCAQTDLPYRSSGAHRRDRLRGSGFLVPALLPGCRPGVGFAVAVQSPGVPELDVRVVEGASHGIDVPHGDLPSSIPRQSPAPDAARRALEVPHIDGPGAAARGVPAGTFPATVTYAEALLATAGRTGEQSAHPATARRSRPRSSTCCPAGPATATGSCSPDQGPARCDLSAIVPAAAGRCR